MIKSKLREQTPDFLHRLIIRLKGGWKGNYGNWNEALEKSSGYNNLAILEAVKKAAMMVKDGKYKFERDSVVFQEIEYSFPVLSAIMWIAAMNKGRLHVIDFGGALGSSYYQNKFFLDTLGDVKWYVVDQEHFVREGNIEFADETLRFCESIEECLQQDQIDVVLLSSVIQYLESPYEFLLNMVSFKLPFIIFDRTPFVKGPDRITVQKVNPKIYQATYPCWFLNQKRFLDQMLESYELILDFTSVDKANIRSEFKGFIFRLITSDA